MKNGTAKMLETEKLFKLNSLKAAAAQIRSNIIVEEDMTGNFKKILDDIDVLIDKLFKIHESGKPSHKKEKQIIDKIILGFVIIKNRRVTPDNLKGLWISSGFDDQFSEDDIASVSDLTTNLTRGRV